LKGLERLCETRSPKAIRDLEQHVIARLVTQRVVDSLEAGQVQVYEPTLDAVTVCERQRHAGPLLEQPPVGQIRKRIVVRHALELALQSLSRRDVDDRALDHRLHDLGILHDERVLQHPDRRPVPPRQLDLAVGHGAVLLELFTESPALGLRSVEVGHRASAQVGRRFAADQPGKGVVDLEDRSVA
jgi:hypothetical protein